MSLCRPGIVRWGRLALLLQLALIVPGVVTAQHSVAHKWNEALLDAIREDFARPTVHARNLFHTSVALYDAWAAYDQDATPYLLGSTIRGFACPFTGVPVPADVQEARQEALSYAAYRLLMHRFELSPGNVASQASFDSLMAALGYDASFRFDRICRRTARGTG